MPNGRPGDHPLTDLLVHGLRPIPEDIEYALREIHCRDPSLLQGESPISSREYYDWEAGRNLEAGRQKLEELLERLSDAERPGNKQAGGR